MQNSEQFLIDLLKKRGPMTTTEIEKVVSKEAGDCPDGSVKSLMKLKRKGIVDGKMVVSKRGWVWKIKD